MQVNTIDIYSTRHYPAAQHCLQAVTRVWRRIFYVYIKAHKNLPFCSRDCCSCCLVLVGIAGTLSFHRKLNTTLNKDMPMCLFLSDPRLDVAVLSELCRLWSVWLAAAVLKLSSCQQAVTTTATSTECQRNRFPWLQLLHLRPPQPPQLRPLT